MSIPLLSGLVPLLEAIERDQAVPQRLVDGDATAVLIANGDCLQVPQRLWLEDENVWRTGRATLIGDRFDPRTGLMVWNPRDVEGPVFVREDDLQPPKRGRGRPPGSKLERLDEPLIEEMRRLKAAEPERSVSSIADEVAREKCTWGASHDTNVRRLSGGYSRKHGTE